MTKDRIKLADVEGIYNNEFGQAVEDFMRRKNLTQTQMANLMGFSQPVVSSIVNGRDLVINRFLAICLNMNKNGIPCSVSDLLTGRGL